jgi:ribonuclease HI
MLGNEKHIYPKPNYGIAVDGSSRGNPGPSEYRGVDCATGKELFRIKVGIASNNIAEYLGIVHAISYIYSNRLINCPIYSDSYTARNWVEYGNVRSNFDFSTNPELKELFSESIEYIRNRKALPKIFNWNKNYWGENVADFGYKGYHKKIKE